MIVYEKSVPVDLSSTDALVTGAGFPETGCLGLFVEGAGAVKFDAGGLTDTWTVPAGTTIPLVITKVHKTGTTATGIHALY